MKLFIDEWTGITTPKGEKIEIHFHSNEDDDSKINILFYDYEDCEKNGYLHFEERTLKVKDNVTELRFLNEEDLEE